MTNCEEGPARAADRGAVFWKAFPSFSVFRRGLWTGVLFAVAASPDRGTHSRLIIPRRPDEWFAGVPLRRPTPRGEPVLSAISLCQSIFFSIRDWMFTCWLRAGTTIRTRSRPARRAGIRTSCRQQGMSGIVHLILWRKKRIGGDIQLFSSQIRRRWKTPYAPVTQIKVRGPLRLRSGQAFDCAGSALRALPAPLRMTERMDFPRRVLFIGRRIRSGSWWP